MQSYKNLKLTGLFEKISLHDVKIKQKYNNHATLYISGMIPQGEKETPILRNIEKQAISLVAESEEGEQQNIFCGITTWAAIKHTGGLYNIEIRAFSYSYLIDVMLESRSFQNVKQTYDEVIENLMQGVDGQYINDDERKDEPIAQFTMQYLETRWQFEKRLISRHNLGLIPDITSEKLAYWVGLPKGREAHIVKEIPFESYRTTKQDNANIENNIIEGAQENDFFYYVLRNKLEHYLLGDKICFQGLTFRIIEISSYLDHRDGVLRHDYTITTHNGCKQPTFYNEQIRGLSLESSVIDRRKDFTKVHLFTIDKDQNVEKASWFRQPTYYTAGKAAGWCAMPELGDQLSLHFPTTEENDCYLMDSTQVPYSSAIYPNVDATSKAGMNPYSPTSGVSKTEKNIPDSKFIIAPQKQNMLLEDEMIRFSSKGASSTLSLFTAHEDASGTTLGIQINTQSAMNLSSKKIKFGEPQEGEEPTNIINFQSNKDISFICDDSSIILNKKTGMADSATAKIILLPPDK